MSGPTDRSAASRRLLVPVLEVGGSHVTAALVDLDAGPGPAVHGRRRAALDAAEPSELIVQRFLTCASVVDAPPGSVWGVAVPGPFDYAEGVGRYSGVGKFDALYGVDLRAQLLRRLPSQPAGVVFINDAEAFLRGEWAAGAARGHGRAIGITLGTGIGSAFLAQGHMIVEGSQVPPGGSVHLLTVGGAPLEEIVSSRAIMRSYAGAAGGLNIGVRAVAERARAGDSIARDVLHAAFTALGEALAPWVRRFRPSVLVVGGSMARSWDLTAAAVETGIRGGSTATRGMSIVPAEQPELAPLIGAAWQTVHPRSRCVGPRQQQDVDRTLV